MRKGVSLSTLRRYIKANKIEYKVEKGRYLLPDEAELPSTHLPAHISSAPTGAKPLGFTQPAASTSSRVQQLERELKRAREENAELKTLIALYEERMA